MFRVNLIVAKHYKCIYIYINTEMKLALLEHIAYHCAIHQRNEQVDKNWSSFMNLNQFIITQDIRHTKLTLFSYLSMDFVNGYVFLRSHDIIFVGSMSDD